ncbi:MAG: hypothetical protein HY870_22280 [Chloroflexi bacterium]|nr:hypothetical protein [Chloroflexota bacterium]
MRKLVALPFGLMFVLLLLVMLTVLSLRTFAFEPSFYTGVLKDRGVFQDFERDPLKYIDLTTQFSQLETLSADTQRQIITAALPPGWLEQSLKNALQGAFDWLESDEAPPPTIALDLRPIKDRLQGPPGRAIAQEVVDAIPTCAEDQSPQLSFDRLPECWPGNLDRVLIVDRVADVLDISAIKLPASLDMGGQLVSGSIAASLVEVRQWMKVALLDAGLLLLAAATLVIWLIGALIGGRSSKERLTWTGGWLLFGALAAVGVYALIFVGGTRAVLLTESVTLPEGLTSAAMSAAQNLAVAALQQLALWAVIPAAGLLIVAVVLIGAGAARRKHSRF